MSAVPSGLGAAEEIDDKDNQKDDYQDADQSVTRSSDCEHFSSSSTFLCFPTMRWGLTRCCVALLLMPVATVAQCGWDDSRGPGRGAQTSGTG